MVPELRRFLVRGRTKLEPVRHSFDSGGLGDGQSGRGGGVSSDTPNWMDDWEKEKSKELKKMKPWRRGRGGGEKSYHQRNGTDFCGRFSQKLNRGERKREKRRRERGREGGRGSGGWCSVAKLVRMQRNVSEVICVRSMSIQRIEERNSIKVNPTAWICGLLFPLCSQILLVVISGLLLLELFLDTDLHALIALISRLCKLSSGHHSVCAVVCSDCVPFWRLIWRVSLNHLKPHLIWGGWPLFCQ